MCDPSEKDIVLICSWRENYPRSHLPGSKPILRDRCCDGMIDNRAPLPWVEAQDRPRRGAREIEKGAPGATVSIQPHQKPPDTIPKASRNNTESRTHIGNIRDTFSTTFYNKNTTTTTASDNNHMSEVTTESAGLAPCGASLGQSVRLTLDAARRKGSPQTYRASRRIQPQNSLRGQRPKAQKNSTQSKHTTRLKK